MRSPRLPPRGPADDLAARRLAILAADLGRGPAAPTGLRADAPDGDGDGDPVDTGDAWWADHTRIAAPRPDVAVRSAPRPVAADPPEPPEPPALPRPGRHAARRRSSLSGVVPALPALGPAHVAVVAVMVGLGLTATAWWVVRGDAEPAVGPVAAGTVAPLVAAADPSGARTAPSASASDGASVTVDVTGDVRRPGIVVLDAGARVVDAVEAAGGARRGVDLSGLNLARLLVDGEQIVVGAPAASLAAPTAAAPSGSPGAPTSLVNLNLATVTELETLPDVGPVTAAAIVAWREEHGGFTSVDELLEVDGIGEVTLEKLAPYVTV